MQKSLVNFLKENELLSRCSFSDDEMELLAYQVEKRFLAEYLGGIVVEIEDVMGISPLLDWREILEVGAQKIVKYLGADAGSIRLYDPETGNMVAFGSHQFHDYARIPSIPLGDSIAGLVVRSGKSYIVPDILAEPLYRDKDVVFRLGLNSLLAVPIYIPRFLETETEIRGALQIYYREKNRQFDPLEVTHAEVLARRISHVVARKRIIDLSQLNLRKEKLVEKIFLKLSNREGIKLRDLFKLMVPELVSIIEIQSCALFSLSPDRETAWLEISYPMEQTQGKVGHAFSVSEHPYMMALLQENQENMDTETERIDPSYVLIKDPATSWLSNEALVSYMRANKLNSVLLIPLRGRAEVRYFMVFYTADIRQEFTEGEIDLLTFFGKEVMKALRMERLDDILHDIKNPAVAIGGFARRALKLLDNEDLDSVRDKIREALNIVAEETDKIQNLSTSAVIEGRERPVDVGETLKRRFRLNVEAARRLGRTDIQAELLDIEDGLFVYCVPFELERILDNLLMNAAQAVPGEGGVLRARCFRNRENVQIEIINTGSIDEEHINKIRSGEVTGRGLNIVFRFVQSLAGEVDLSNNGSETVFTVRLPACTNC